MEGTTYPCADCGAIWPDGRQCEDAFHQLLAWEAEFPEFWAVHHYLVLCYYLQHPHLYSEAGLAGAVKLLMAFREEGLTTEQMRKRLQHEVDSGQREHKIKGHAASQGRYPKALEWSMTVYDIVVPGPAAYIERVQAWAEICLTDLRQSGNLDSLLEKND